MENLRDKKDQKQERLCLCSALRPAMILCRIFGMFPIVTVHHEGNCVFKKSNLWLAYSIFTIIFVIARAVFTTELFNIFNIGKGKSLHALLSSINDVIYSVYITILTILSVARFPRFVKAFNSIVPVLKEGLLCQSALKVILTIQYAVIIILVIVVAIQYGAITWLHYSDSYETDFDYKIYLNRLTQNATFMLYAVFFCSCSVLMGLLGCFEKLTISALKFKPVHPMKGIDETNNQTEFFGLVKYDLCKEKHPCSHKLLKLTEPELIEYLRCLHEDISIIMYDINNCLNPQFLFHMVVELTVLIVQWYAVIIYTAYDFTTPLASTLHFLNVLFVILHTLGLFTFLKHAQQLHNMIFGLTNFLLEYSTRISGPEEHQQVRIFIEKLKLHRPLTASGVFKIDLGIAGPVSANILTYVLVALQFDVPKT